MNKIIDFFNRRSFLVNLVAASICLIGAFSALTLKRDLIPAFEFNKVIVSIPLPGASTEQMEKLITIPVEESLASLSHLKSYTSTTSEGVSRISLTYEPDADIQLALGEIQSRVTRLKPSLPLGTKDASIRQIKVNDLPLLGYALENFDVKNTKHREWLKSFRSDIQKLKGISGVETTLPTIQIELKFRARDLARYGLTQSEIRRRIEESLVFLPVSKLSHKDSTYNVEVDATPKNIDSILAIPLRTNTRSGSILIRNVASIKIIEVEKKRVSLVGDKEILTIKIRKNIDSDAIDLSEKIKLYITSLDEDHKNPFSFKFINLFDTSTFVSRQLNILKSNGALGLLLVGLLLGIVIGFRFAIVTLFGIPVAYLGTVIVLGMCGISFDLISSIAMILIVGILVDDAIIIAEKYAELLESGMEHKQASYEAATSMIIPVTGTILTTIIAFAPILFIRSEVSAIFFSIPVVIISALALSWLESFFFLPNHLQHFVGVIRKSKTRRFEKITDLYEKLLRFSLKIRYITILGLIGLFVGAGIIGSDLRKDFNLNISSAKIIIKYELKSAASFADAQEQTKDFYHFLKKETAEDVTLITRDLGTTWMGGSIQEGPRFARIRLRIREDIKRPLELANKLRDRLKPKLAAMEKAENGIFTKIKMYDSRKSSKKGEDKKSDDQIKIHVSGDDKLSTAEIETLIRNSLKDYPEVRLESNDSIQTRTVWSFKVSSKNAETYRLTPREITSQIRGAVGKRDLKEIRIDGASTMIVTTLDTITSTSFAPSKLKTIKILTKTKDLIPISYLGQWVKTDVPKKIYHRRGLKTLTLSVDFIEGLTDRKQAAKTVEKALISLHKDHPSYSFDLQAESEQDKEMNTWAIKLVVICVTGILLVLALVLNSLTQPFVVGLAIPFGIVGVVLALKAHDLPLSMMAIIGLVGVAGVAVNDSLIMVDSINKLRGRSKVSSQKPIEGQQPPSKRRKQIREIIIVGCRSRFRAIFLTTVTTLGGVFPMAYGLFGESGFTQPLAFAMAWGLLCATFLTLFVIPSMYEIRDDFFTGCSKLYGWRPGRRRRAQSNLKSTT